MASSWSQSEPSSASDMSDGSWNRVRPDMRDAECQTEQLPCMMPLAEIMQAAVVAAPAHAAVVAAPAQAAAQSSAQPPAQLPQLGEKDGYFLRLGNESGRWGIVNNDTSGKSGSGKRYRRAIPRCFPGADENEETRLRLVAHTRYWMDVFFDVRKLSEKLRYTEDKTLIHERIRHQIPKGCLFYKLHHAGRPPAPREHNDHDYFHGSYLHTLWNIAESERFLPSFHGSGEGHEASTPGVYASDQFEKASHYGWAIDPFGSGLFYRFVWVLRAKPTRCMERHNRHRGTPWHEIVFPPSEVDILGVLVLPDVALPQGTPRFYELNLDLETLPKGKSRPPEVRVDTPCRDPPGKWGDW